MLLLLVLVILILALGGGYYGDRLNPGYGPSFGVGTIVVVLLLLWLFGAFRR